MKIDKKIFIFFLVVFCIITQNNYCLADNTTKRHPINTYNIYVVPGMPNAICLFHIFLISIDGGNFSVLDLQLKNKDNVYELNNFIENINYFLLVVSFGDSVVVSPNILHFFKPTNKKKIIRSIPLNKEPKKNNKKALEKYEI